MTGVDGTAMSNGRKAAARCYEYEYHCGTPEFQRCPAIIPILEQSGTHQRAVSSLSSEEWDMPRTTTTGDRGPLGRVARPMTYLRPQNRRFHFHSAVGRPFLYPVQ